MVPYDIRVLANSVEKRAGSIKQQLVFLLVTALVSAGIAYFVANAVVDRLTIYTAGGHSVGTEPDPNIQLRVGGAFQGATDTVGIGLATHLVGNASNNVIGMLVAPQLVPADRGMHPLMGALSITNDLARGNSAIANAFSVRIAGFVATPSTMRAQTLYVESPPTGARENNAITVNNGRIALGDVTIRGQAVEDPPAPGPDQFVLFARKDPRGKIQLCALFATGVSQCFATQP